MENWYKAVIIGIVIMVGVWAMVLTWPDNKLHVVVYDVGQGDAILVSYGTSQILVDGGPGERVMGCLENHLPFWDRTIEVMMLTHPQLDHYGGLTNVLDVYNVSTFVTVDKAQETERYVEFVKRVAKENSRIVNIEKGELIKLGNSVRFEVVWPTRNWLDLYNNVSEVDLNRFGIVGNLNFGNFDMLFTADTDVGVMDEIIKNGELVDVDVLKVPHHGSGSGMRQDWLNIIYPELAIISSGKNNTYGHPSSISIDLLSNNGIKIMRTDQEGDIEVISNGMKWWLGKPYNAWYELGK